MLVTARPPLAFSAGLASSLCCWLIGIGKGLPVTGPQMDLKELRELDCPALVLLQGIFLSQGLNPHYLRLLHY